MNIFEIILISFGLAMDAFSVAICKGVKIKKLTIKKSVIIGLWFGIFQSIMPIIGFLLGNTFSNIITSIDHWVAFFLLFFLGIDMIFEVFKNEENTDDDISFKSMIVLSIATSIDALAIGIAYVCAYGSYHATYTFITIGILTFIISIIGTKIGNKCGLKYENKAKIFGGIILILMGIKILFEHLNLL